MSLATLSAVCCNVHQTSQRTPHREEPAVPDTETATGPEAPSPEHDRHRAWRIAKGRQTAVDVPVATLSAVVAGSAHARDALTEALGEKTVRALSDVPAQRAG